MGNKEKILEILKQHKDGLILVDIDTEYNIEHGRKLGHDLYNYLSRLVDMGLVEQFRPEVRTGKILGFTVTDKACEAEDLEKLKEITKDLIIKREITDIQERDLRKICQL